MFPFCLLILFIRFHKWVKSYGMCLFFFMKDFICLFLERGQGRDKERERNINVWLLLTCPLGGDLASNPGMCPDWESNRQPFGSQATTQYTEPQQPRNYLPFSYLLISLNIMFFRSIHAVWKGEILFFYMPSSIPLCKCFIVVLFAHLLWTLGLFTNLGYCK